METVNEQDHACPFCGATDRDRLYALYLEKVLGDDIGTSGVQMVDFAPVRCLSAHIRAKMRNLKGSYRTADLFMPDVDDKVDLTDMRLYRDGQFDFFICSHVLEHVPDDRKALRELYRITKPGGSGIVMAPIALDVAAIDEDPTVTEEEERVRRFGQHDHLRLYSKAGFVQRVREAGFDVTELGMAEFGADKFNRLGLSAGSVLYIATHPA